MSKVVEMPEQMRTFLFGLATVRNGLGESLGGAVLNDDLQCAPGASRPVATCVEDWDRLFLV